MSRPVVGIPLAVRAARFGPWNQDVAMVPSTMVAAVHQLGWLALLVAADAALAAEPEDALRLLDGLIVPDWGERGDRYAEFSRALVDAAVLRGLPVVRLPASLVAQEPPVSDYVRAMADLFSPEARTASGSGG